MLGRAAHPCCAPQLHMPMTHSFRISPARYPALIILGAIDVMLLLIVLRFVFTLSSSPAEAWVGVMVTLGVSMLFSWFLLQQARSLVHVTETHLHVKVPIYGRRVALQDIDLAAVRIMSEDEAETWRLTWRTNGIGLPGYQVGWFSSRKGGKILAARTGGDVVLVPTSKRYTIMLSLQDPGAFVEHMHGLVRH